MKNWWHSLSFNDTCSFILASKLKALKALLKFWNRDVFGRMKANKRKVLQRTSSWDDLEKNKPLSLEEFEEQNLAKEDLNIGPCWRNILGDRNPKSCG